MPDPMTPEREGRELVREGTVADIHPAELLGRAVRSGRPAKRGGEPRWCRVMRLFGLGRTYAQQLCLMYGRDPDEMVSRR